MSRPTEARPEVQSVPLHSQTQNTTRIEAVHMKVYFDNNATTPLHPEVKKEMTAAMEM
jgi:hypothetical protein